MEWDVSDEHWGMEEGIVDLEGRQRGTNIVSKIGGTSDVATWSGGNDSGEGRRWDIWRIWNNSLSGWLRDNTGIKGWNGYL